MSKQYSMQDEFENWMSIKGFNSTKNSDGVYTDLNTYRFWVCWKTSYESVLNALVGGTLLVSSKPVPHIENELLNRVIAIERWIEQQNTQQRQYTKSGFNPDATCGGGGESWKP